MITGILSKFPGTEEPDVLMNWCENVSGQYSGDIPLTVKQVLDHQDTAEAMGGEIRVLREALRDICRTRDIMPAAIEQRKTLLKTTDKELRRQSQAVQITLKKQVDQCLVRYIDTLSLALAIAENKESPRPGEYMNVDASSISLRDGEPVETDEAAINEWLNDQPISDNEPVNDASVLDDEDGESETDSGQLLL